MFEKNNLDFVYKEEILKRSINPGFSSKLSKVDKFISGLNPFCGDEVKFHFNLSKKGNLKEMANNLYKTMRKIKKRNFKSIAVCKIPDLGIGRAINDRLRKASYK